MTEKSNQEGRRKLDREFYNPRTTTERYSENAEGFHFRNLQGGQELDA